MKLNLNDTIVRSTTAGAVGGAAMMTLAGLAVVRKNPLYAISLAGAYFGGVGGAAAGCSLAMLDRVLNSHELAARGSNASRPQ